MRPTPQQYRELERKERNKRAPKHIQLVVRCMKEGIRPSIRGGWDRSLRMEMIESCP